MTIFSDIRRSYFHTKRQLYFKTLGLFVGLIVGTFIHGALQRSDGTYEVVRLYEPYFVQQGSLSVVKKEYNFEENSYRMDLFISSTGYFIEDAKRKVEATAVTQREPDREKKVKVISVTNSYFVLFVENYTEKEGMLRLDVDYFSNETTNQLFSFYTSTEHAIEVKKSLLNYKNQDLMIDSITNDIRLQEEAITESEKESKKIEQEIQQRLAQYEQLETDKVFQVGEDLKESEQQMLQLRSMVSNLQGQLKQEEDNRKEGTKKIALLAEKIVEVSE